jgi:hypothetical protein
VFDSARAAVNYFLIPNSTAAQNVDFSNNVTSFNADGFSLGTGSNENGTGRNYVSWTFRKQPKFFDVVTYTGNSTARTIAHNLGSVPGCIIIKGTTGPASTQNWAVYHRSTGNTKALFLDLTQGPDVATNYWNDTTPTSTVFSLGAGASVNNNTTTYVAYLFAHDAGGFGATGTDNVISCGSFTTGAGGSASVNIGFEPQYLLVKCSSAAQNWRVFDVMRGFSMTTNVELYPNTSDSDQVYSVNRINPTATGFEAGQVSASPFFASQTYIYIAIRRGPMKVPTSGTSVFAPVFASTSTTPNFISGFPADVSIRKFPSNSTQSPELETRLTNTKLETGATSVEGSTDSNWWTWMNGVAESGYNGQIGWLYRRAPSFFDVVCYTGTGSARTVTHNLGVVPEIIIVKKRSGAFEWIVLSPAGLGYLRLNTNEVYNSNDVLWNSTAPTSTVFSLGPYTHVNGSAETYVAYLFATCAGVSKVGSYTGTGTTKQIDCGFTGGARFVLIKRTDSTGDWYVWDSARGIVSGNDSYLLLNSTAAEVTNTDYIDTYSAGFEISSTAPAAINASGGSFIFFAVA